MIENVLPISELRANLPKILKLIDRLHQTFTITQRGKPEAVIMNIEEYEGWLETMEIMADKNLRKELKRADEDVNKGRLYSHKEVFGKEL